VAGAKSQLEEYAMSSPVSLLTLIIYLVTLLGTSQTSFTILGTVRDKGGRPVPSIRVSLLNQDYQTMGTEFADTSGRFKFNAVPQGRYSVRVEPVGTPYEEQTQQFELVSLSASTNRRQETHMVDFILKTKRSTTMSSEPGVIFSQTVPANAKAEYERGLSGLKDSSSDDGIMALTRAIELFPDYYAALELLGTEYVKREKFDAAVPLLLHAQEVNRNAPRTLYALGVAHLKLKRSAEAVDWLLKASAYDADNSNIYMMLGLAYGSNRMDDAEAAFKKAYKLGGPQVADVHLYLAAIYNKKEHYPEAVRELELYLKESKEVKDRNQIKTMIDSIKAKQKTRN
jgi:tetratricopeptide (TPR) repeat protein